MDLFLHENLRKLRQKYGYSLEALAEIISVSRQTAAKWESGDSCPDLVNCIKLSSLYKVSLDELVSKPLLEEFSESNNRIGGMLEIQEDSSIILPKVVMDMFDLHPGEKVLLLGDKAQGLAIVKCSQF